MHSLNNLIWDYSSAGIAIMSLIASKLDTDALMLCAQDFYTLVSTVT